MVRRCEPYVARDGRKGSDWLNKLDRLFHYLTQEDCFGAFFAQPYGTHHTLCAAFRDADGTLSDCILSSATVRGETFRDPAETAEAVALVLGVRLSDLCIDLATGRPRALVPLDGGSVQWRLRAAVPVLLPSCLDFLFVTCSGRAAHAAHLQLAACADPLRPPPGRRVTVPPSTLRRRGCRASSCCPARAGTRSTSWWSRVGPTSAPP